MAVGEAACVSVHGANRLGSNSLLDLVVFGREAARHCAASVKPGTRHRPLAKDAGDLAVSRIDRLRNAKGSLRTADIRLDMQRVMQTHAAVFRTGESLERGRAQARRSVRFVRRRERQRPLAHLEHRPDRDAGAGQPARPGGRDDPLGGRTARRAAARTRARTSPSATMSNWMKHTLAWVDARGAGAPRLPAGAPEHADQRRRADPAEGASVLSWLQDATGQHGAIPSCPRIQDPPRQDCFKAPAGAKQVRSVPHLPLRSGVGREPARRHLRGRHGELRADGSRRADQDQERDRSDADVPPLVPRGHLRLVRDEHRRRQHARLHAGQRRHPRRRQDLSAAAHAGHQGSGAGPHGLLCAVRLGEAVAADAHAGAAGPRAAAVEGGPGKDRSARGLHPVRLLLDVLPELLVEQRSLPRARRPCWRRIAGSSTRATRRPASGSTRSRIRSGCIAATRS